MELGAFSMQSKCSTTGKGNLILPSFPTTPCGGILVSGRLAQEGNILPSNQAKPKQAQWVNLDLCHLYSWCKSMLVCVNWSDPQEGGFDAAHVGGTSELWTSSILHPWLMATFPPPCSTPWAWLTAPLGIAPAIGTSGMPLASLPARSEDTTLQISFQHFCDGLE